MLFAIGVGLPEILILIGGVSFVGLFFFIYRAGVNAGLAKARREHIEDRNPRE